ncbi:peptidyl-alpha-hydroxyglycine alpha-amidating lyase family protein [Bacillus sp. FSL H8-0547]
MNKVNTLLLEALSITGLIVWFSQGGSDVIFKEKQVVIPVTKTYSPVVLWPKTPEEKSAAGEGSGVAVNSEGDIYYFHRASGEYSGKNFIKEPTIVVLDGKTKKVKRIMGEGMFKSPHGLEIDSEDNIWVTDVSLNKVFKLSPEGKLMQSFGEDYQTGLEWSLRIRNLLPNFPVFMDEYTFARPTDVTVMDDGSFAVADGYRNRRIVKFDREGKLEWQIDKPGSQPGEFNLPHGISSDSEGRIYVADRSNARIQVFDKNGQYLDRWDMPEIGRPFGVEAASDGNIYVVDGGDSLNGAEGNFTSQIIVLDKQGTILERFGTWGSKEGQMKIPHDLAVDANGTIYVAELKNRRIQAFIKQ